MPESKSEPVKAMVTRRRAGAIDGRRRLPARQTSFLPVASGERIVRAFLAGKKPATLRAYRRALEDFRKFTRHKTINRAAAELLASDPGPANETALEYRHELQERKLSPATVNLRLAALRSLVKLARKLGMVTWALEVDNMPVEAYRDTAGPGLAGVIAIFRAVKGRTPKAKRDRAILRMFYDLGLRRAEVVGLDVTDLHFNGEGATVEVIGKGKMQSRKFSLPAATRAALELWLKVHPTGTGALFRNFDPAHKGDGRLTADGVYLLVRTYGAAAGVTVRPHGLRHTSITEAVKAATAAGIGLDEVLQFSRHKNLKTLMIYRDRERNVHGQLAELVSAKAPGRRGPKRPPAKRGAKSKIRRGGARRGQRRTAPKTV